MVVKRTFRDSDISFRYFRDSRRSVPFRDSVDADQSPEPIASSEIFVCRICLVIFMFSSGTNKNGVFNRPTRKGFCFSRYRYDIREKHYGNERRSLIMSLFRSKHVENFFNIAQFLILSLM